ncbi:MAG TPA: hypothetical protein VF611_21795 [Pyrinomonadaceae bacterium]|jgi:hypothetical protein
MKAETEIWQVSTPDGVYQADLPTLKQWVAEGVVLPTDRVRKGSLNWIDAGRAPLLRRVFSGEERVEFSEQPAQPAAAQPGPQAGPAPTPQPTSDLGLAGDADAQTGLTSSQADFAVGTSASGSRAAHAFEVEWAEPLPGGAAAPGSSCHFHPAQAATLVCRMCGETFCRPCANRVGTSSVLLCALCGGFCDPLDKLTERLALYERQGEGFGLSDLRQALAYPFRHLASLLGGALLYGFLLLAGMRGQLLATALVFGCISLVVRRVAYGNLRRDFLPDFSEFSFWDDVIVPCALGVGVTVVTLGPTLLLLGALLLGWLGGPQSPSRLTSLPLAGVGQQAEAADEGITQDDMGTLVNGGTAEEEAELEKKINAMRPGVRAARTLEETGQDDTTFGVAARLLERPGLILVLGLLALGWAVFYHPMALLVAGWTESLKSVLNPLVGIDTMRHMGFTYFKAFFMYLAVQAVSLLLSFVVGLVTAPFNMPLVGNLPGTFLSGVVTFYASLVIACVLGLALFKTADRLGIDLD